MVNSSYRPVRSKCTALTLIMTEYKIITYNEINSFHCGVFFTLKLVLLLVAILIYITFFKHCKKIS